MERNEIHKTNLEEAVGQFLDKRGVNYTPQYPVRLSYVIDFALVDRKIAIEVDGTHWHSGKKKQKKDRFRDYMLKRTGWRTIRIKEAEIDNLDSLLSSVI